MFLRACVEKQRRGESAIFSLLGDVVDAALEHDSLSPGDRLLLKWHQCELPVVGNLYPCYVYGARVDRTSAYVWFPWDLVVFA